MNRILKLAGLLVLAASGFAAGPSRLPFLHDDYANALAQAKARKLPIFVEVSAPW